ncbi:MAG: DUF433 domain-containing protein [Moorea sp. SIO1F2]|uniref:DUF433 domain-containing protein n=1 Tax=Moorena sp. SIO1F2 TaxID=2607819 RepID=UPI0013BD7DBA|nr:DUF433 domain-containing protein [Moorena sp. SIO1F2]NEO65279.1 DUF433 domain-containing protein [Moorena sp. SIO4G2]NET85086.1 DUF433 domain-containing protein [Moorena sp. SIO1F2]
MSIQQITTEYIAIDPDYCYGKPRIAGTRMPVAAIAEMYLEMKESLEEIAHKYDLSLAQVHGAMAYYFEYQEEIDRHTIETDRLVEQIKGNSPTSTFQEQWRQITGER